MPRAKAVEKVAGKKPSRKRAAKKVWHFRLYVAGQTPKSLAALANLKEFCERYLPGQYDIEVIDLVRNPKQAREDQIVAIPTLVRRLPAPIRKIIGDLSHTPRIVVGLQLEAGVLES